jgi:3'-5' exoribonuclease
MTEQATFGDQAALLPASANGSGRTNGDGQPSGDGRTNGDGQPGGVNGRVSVRDLADGALSTVLAVRDFEVRKKKNGEDFLQLMLGDATGKVRAISWDDVEGRRALCAAGAILWVNGDFKADQRWGATLTIREMRVAEPGEYEVDDLVGMPAVSVERLEADFRELISTVQDGDLRALLDRLFGEGTSGWERFREAPAAKYYHEAFRHGLLAHTVSMAQAVSAAAAAFPGLDRDVAVTGALIHDIGKTQAYNDDLLAIDLTDAGRLQGEIPLGYFLVRTTIESIDGFAPATAQAILHILLSHHGTYENGSPVVPCTREATLVHMMDNLGGKLGSFDRIERELPEGETWSRFDRGIDASAYFGSRAA